ncbi:MAG: aldehyde dehydrogenase family protein, partial [Rhizorhabdus sp.]
MTQYPASPLYIDGALRPADGGRSYDNIAPASAEAVGQAADASAADMDAAIAAARKAFDTTAWPTDVTLRVDWLNRLQAKLADIADDH